jgi:hypothetical protein
LGNPAESISGVAGDCHGFGEQIRTEFAERIIGAQRERPDPSRVAGEECLGEDNRSRARTVGIDNQLAGALERTMAAEECGNGLGRIENGWPG